MGHTANHPETAITATDTHTMETFIGILAHEIRSQIAAICSLSDIILYNQKMQATEQAECISAINATGYYALNVVENMTATAKYSNGRLDLDPHYKRFHFREWLKQLVQQFDRAVAAVSVKIRIDIANNVPENIITDQVKLGQVLYNLINNAIKFTRPATSINLNISLNRDKQLSFQVSDQGGGIAEDKLKFLFQPFKQLEKGRAGTGLGLYISHLCVTSLGGEITAFNENGGTTFSFFIPLRTEIPSV
ncbi:sensor histidine kinase [Chitinophaga japonensis]|uniref:histidine kinase n=1 Tax=Chitinophaga japonensis TaxID=104662 RepID=A0A562TCS2_CHIJA|nr:HAMP domain-containing sensor histidine kinase [Chitinophaga japonensis]TWI91302.1 histidine kinase/DNA gyrase B/HSP90-like ATPase [Chitinophaga japonensis]